VQNTTFAPGLETIVASQPRFNVCAMNRAIEFPCRLLALVFGALGILYLLIKNRAREFSAPWTLSRNPV